MQAVFKSARKAAIFRMPMAMPVGQPGSIRLGSFTAHANNNYGLQYNPSIHI